MASRRWVRPTEALAIGLSAWLLFSCTSDTSTDSHSTKEGTARTASALNTSPTIGNFVLYAERSINVGSHDQVTGGDVGIAAVAVSSFGDQLTLSDHVQVDPAHNVLSPSVTLGPKCQVGDVQADVLHNNGAQSLGNVAPYPGAAAMPSMPLAGSPATSTFNITVASHSTTTLSPGSYGALAIADHAQVTLTAGAYSFSSISISDHVQVATDPAGVTLLISGQLATSGWDQVQPSGGATASALTILVSGTDDPSSATQAASIGQHTQLTALVAAPHGTLAVADHVQATGALVAFDLTLATQVQVTLQNGFSATTGGAQQGSQQLAGYGLPPSSPVVGPVPANMPIALGAVLPLRDPAGLAAFISAVSDPTNAMYRQYESISDFASNHGALPSDYQEVMDWAHSFTPTVTSYANDLLVDAIAPAAQVEQALFVNLMIAVRPDGTQFYEPDRIPTFNLTVPLDGISGVDNYLRPRPMLGTGPGGSYLSSDFRTAYLGSGSSCSQLTGKGQSVGIVSFDGYTPTVGSTPGDIQTYETINSLTNVPAVNPVLVNLPNGALAPSGTLGSVEAAGDIELVMAMAPGATIIPFQGTSVDSVLAAMATTPGLYQITDSWIDGSNTAQRWVDEFAAQGQTYFHASGDNGAYMPITFQCSCPCNGNQTENITLCPSAGTCSCTGISPSAACGTNVPPAIDTPPQDSRGYPNVTLAGGTVLSTGLSQVYIGETTWAGTGGGILLFTPFPSYQQGVPNLATTTSRNAPDVAMPAANFLLVATTCSVAPVNGACPSGKLTPDTTTFPQGTSGAAPMWAGFTALINEYGFSQDPQYHQVGFLNPLVYQIGKDANRYKNAFHDVNDGSNENNTCGFGYTAGPGYDNATGWGSPSCGLVQQAQVRPSISVGVTNPSNGGPVVCLSGQGFTKGGTVTIQFTGIPEDDDSHGNPTTQVFNNAVVVDSTGSIHLIDNGQAGYQQPIAAGVTDCTAARISSGQVAVQAVDNTTGVTATADVPASFWCTLGPEDGPPLTFGADCPTVQITYHQTGACATFTVGSQGFSVGANAAYVVFGVESILNNGTSTFNFDESQVFVQQGVTRSFFDPTLDIYADIFGPFALTGYSVAPGDDFKLDPSGDGAAVVGTTTTDGAQQANMTSYFLNYQPVISDPAVQFTKSNASQSVFPITDDCSLIQLY